jgi:cytochrome c oxidase subunit II
VRTSPRACGNKTIPAPRARQCLAALFILSSLLAACVTPQTPNALDPRGPGTAQLTNLWWLMFWLGLGVFILTMGILVVALYQARRSGPEEDPRPVSGRAIIILGGVVMPLPILGIVLGYTIYTGNITAPQALRGDPAPEGEHLTIDVFAHQYWWEARYLEQGIHTANEIHIPVGQPVEFRLTSSDVIHSFWVPQLHGKIDNNPGETNTLWLQADEPGIYRGICAEFCGLQHAHMQFLIIAQPLAEFTAWVAQQQLPPAEPTDDLTRRGQEVFMNSACVYCHSIGDTVPQAPPDLIGPDLTHLASRRTLAAAMIENNRGNLGGWIVDPQSIKPGNRMPPTRLSSDDFIALLAYLESLR